MRDADNIFDKTFLKYSVQFLVVVAIVVFTISVIGNLTQNGNQYNRASGIPAVE